MEDRNFIKARVEELRVAGEALLYCAESLESHIDRLETVLELPKDESQSSNLGVDRYAFEATLYDFVSGHKTPSTEFLLESAMRLSTGILDTSTSESNLEVVRNEKDMCRLQTSRL